MPEKAIDRWSPARSGEPSNEKLFDAAVALDRLDDDNELFSALIDIFQEDSVVLYTALRASLAGGELAEVERAAHSLKGLAANFEARGTTAVALRVEELARAGEVAGLEELVAELGVKLHELRGALADWKPA